MITHWTDNKNEPYVEGDLYSDYKEAVNCLNCLAYLDLVPCLKCDDLGRYVAKSRDAQINEAYGIGVHLYVACPFCNGTKFANRNVGGLDNYAKEVHKANKKWWVCLKCDDKGRYIANNSKIDELFGIGEYLYIKCPFCDGTKVKNRNIGEMLALMHSELSEALEGDRKGLMDNHLPQYKMFDVELVDCFIRIMDVVGAKGIKFEEIYRAKMEYNAKREDHKLEERVKEGGKRY